MDKLKITEEMHLEKEWFEEAKKQTLATLPKFMEHVLYDYLHDYGTICHAISACALAATYAADASDCGGITGFQAGFVMWNFVRQWIYPGNRSSLRIVDYDDMLYPQHESKFQKTITKTTWELLQKEAGERIKKYPEAHDTVKLHWASIVAGKVPFGYTVVED